MSSKKDLPESTVSPVNNSNEDNTKQDEHTNITDPPRPTSQSSNCSRSTDESVTAFIERTVTAVNFPEPESTVVLPVREGATAHSSTATFAFQKASVSEAIVITPSQPIDPTGQLDTEEATSQEEAAPLYGDTTDVEELLDSSGVAAFPAVSRNVTLDPGEFPDLEAEFQLEPGHSDEEQEAYRAKLESSDRQLSAKGRNIIRKYFAAATPIRLPVGHPTVAFNQEQMHAILRTSIYSKGAREILRHYKKEGHLRKDQKWRYVNLQETDSITGIVTQQVRGKDGYVLTPLELEKEKPNFIDIPVVDAGDRYPFYDDYMASIGGLTNPSDLRTSTLISLIGTFVPQDGNLSLLQS